jgi:hypothetical protein
MSCCRVPTLRTRRHRDELHVEDSVELDFEVVVNGIRILLHIPEQSPDLL